MAKRPTRPVAPTGSKQVRCAIYTRKSTEEGLDQAFNSLDAQNEACAAYIASQRHGGWAQVPMAYDDGRHSGGNMERPGLRRLLADVESGRVDVIVVYKVDRLTRSLADFAKIVEVLDARGASFVSVTQAFNTTTSMGRLTLNVLLSFAQFEREVTGERIRDKIAASKKKGLWMGGPVPLGYDVQDRRLVINEAEAETVRLIFTRHQALGTIRELIDDPAASRVLTKRRTLRDGSAAGQIPFTAGPVTHLLRNVIYTGRIRHRDSVYPGEHPPILARGVWEASQAILDGNAPRPHTGQSSLLSGMVSDAPGRPMCPAHTDKSGRRYRYYVSKMSPGDAERAWRLPAGDLENIVVGVVQKLLRDSRRLSIELGQPTLCPKLAAGASELALQVGNAHILQRLGLTVHLQEDELIAEIGIGNLAVVLGAPQISAYDDERIRLTTAISMRRRGHELRLVHAVPM